ncbi:MAG: hypothetical protein HKN46_05275 [Acidimicrobiia bacterium]|nr:hypothetical protein [Acidimicrobiia bacterium]
MSFWRQAMAIARRGLLAEGRSGDLLWVVLPYGALAVFLSPVALDTTRSVLAEVGFGIAWIVVLLFGMFVTFRRSASVSPAEADMVSLLVGDPASVFVGRALASSVLLIGFELAMAPLVLVLFAPIGPSSWWALAGIGALAALGLGMIGTVAGSLVGGLGSAPALAPLLTASLSFPLLVGASVATHRLVEGDGILAPVALLGLVNVALTVAGVLSSRPLEESA